MVAMIAKEHRIPVVACVETYKFGERVLLDGIATNELSFVGEVFELPCSKGIKEDLRGRITSLPLLYDLTPPQLITAVCTEVSSRYLDVTELIIRSASSLLVPYRPYWARGSDPFAHWVIKVVIQGTPSRSITSRLLCNLISSRLNSLQQAKKQARRPSLCPGNSRVSLGKENLITRLPLPKQIETSIHISTAHWLANIHLTLHHNSLKRQIHMITKAILAGRHSD